MKFLSKSTKCFGKWWKDIVQVLGSTPETVKLQPDTQNLAKKQVSLISRYFSATINDTENPGDAYA